MEPKVNPADLLHRKSKSSATLVDMPAANAVPIDEKHPSYLGVLLLVYQLHSKRIFVMFLDRFVQIFKIGCNRLGNETGTYLEL